MRAAIVERFDAPPRFGTITEPEPRDGELLVTVRAAALSNLVRGQAAGRHYSSGKSFPFVPGADGVGTTPDGRRVYFISPRAPHGAMAEQTVVPPSRIIPLPDGVEDVTAAALGNPGIASWGALLGRARLQPGERVLVNGATGVSGQQAVQVAKRLGAARVVATGRDPARLEKLRALGADTVIALEQPEAALATAFHRELREAGVDVVIDFLWGPPAALLLAAAGGHGAPEGEPRIRFVQVGAMAGRDLKLEAEWLRSSGVELMGSGLGSLSAAEMVRALGAMFEAAAKDALKIEVDARPLEQVAEVWPQAESGRRIVFTI